MIIDDGELYGDYDVKDSDNEKGKNIGDENSLWMTMIRTVIMATGKTMLLTMAMKMRMRANSKFFGIPFLLNRMVMKTGQTHCGRRQ